MDIYQVLKDYYEEYSPYYNIFGVFLKGSQNYFLDVAESDIDAIALCIPSQKQMLRNQEIKTHTVDTDYGQITIMDIRNYCGKLRQSSPQEIEILFSNYYYIPTEKNYDELWMRELLTKANDIAYFNQMRVIQALRGQAKSYYCKVEKDKSGKALMNVKRLKYLIHNYLLGKPYKECLEPPRELIKYRYVEITDMLINEAGADIMDIENDVQMYGPYIQYHGQNIWLDILLDEFLSKVLFND